MVESFDTVLIATSLLEESRDVTRLGRDVARACGARIALVHATMMPAWYDQAPLEHMGRQGEILKANMEALRQTIVREARHFAIGDDELAGCFLELAPPHRAVVDLAHRLKAGLIVMGASDRPVRRWHTLGSTAARVTQKTTRPVLVVRGDLPLPLRRVLAPVDLSPLSGDALRCGLGRVRAMGGGALPEIETLFVLNPLERDGWPHFTAEQVDRFAREELGRFLRAHLGEAAASLQAAVRVGEAREVIAREVEGWGPDLIVVGTHGRSGFERFIVGSVASDLVRHSPVSVLVVPPEAAARAALEAKEEAHPKAGWYLVPRAAGEEPAHAP